MKVVGKRVWKKARWLILIACLSVIWSYMPPAVQRDVWDVGMILICLGAVGFTSVMPPCFKALGKE